MQSELQLGVQWFIFLSNHHRTISILFFANIVDLCVCVLFSVGVDQLALSDIVYDISFCVAFCG